MNNIFAQLSSFNYLKSLYFFSLWVIAIGPFNSLANDSLYTHVFTDEAKKKVFFYDSLYVFLDFERDYDIGDILKLKHTEFKRPDSTMRAEPPFVVWTKLKLKNEGKSSRHEYFSFCLEADSIWIYTIEEGKIINEQFAGKFQQPSERSIPSLHSFVPVSVDAGKEKVFYFRTFFSQQVGIEHFTHISIWPDKNIIHSHINNYVWHACYAGIMIFFCGFSLFMFGIFRERTFLYFASLTFFFMLYFLNFEGMLSAFISSWFGANATIVSHFIISGLILSIFLYSNKYVRTKEKLPKYSRIFLVSTIVVILFSHVVRLLGLYSLPTMVFYNFLILVWVFLLVVPIIYLVLRKDKEAKVLLISLGAIFLSAIFFLVNTGLSDPKGTWMEYSFQLGSIAFSGILFYGIFDKINTIRKEKHRMVELDKLKSNFFANISHEFRTPLTLMMGPLQEVIDDTEDTKKLQLLEMAQRNAGRQLKLVNQLLDLSKLDSGKMELRAGKENFIPFLKGMVYSYQSLAVQKNIDLKLVCPEGEIQLYFNRDKMEKILFNLLSNAFKFTPSGGQVSVVLEKKDVVAEVMVSDTGPGIGKEELPYIFDRFFQADLERNTEITGSGIGLALVKELVQLHGGNISVSSKINEGTTFTLHFPLRRDHLTDDAVIESPSLQPNEKKVEFTLPVNSKSPSGNRSSELAASSVPHLLVVEDNADVRAFIRLRLENSFHISEAVNGQEGIDLAIDLMPDLIISDVMMPKKNGYEVCQTLKTDIRTCHIPIILLTARAAQEEKIEGLETGADDYLTKPFNSEELEVRALNLVRLRQQLKERFANSITLKPDEMATNSIDQSFLESVLSIVTSNLANDQFTIDMLSQEIGMSRSNLNRKLRALVNQSTNQFIQSVRLQRASELLEQQAGTVSEIAFKTGFGSTAYFIKCFKEQYGETPGALLSKE